METRREEAVSVAVDNTSRRRRRHDQRGAAVVEFAIASSVLLVLLFGIISYGYALSFKQGLTQAAAEGARAAAVAGSSATTVATTAMAHVMDGYNKHCGTGGLTCTATTYTDSANGCPSASCVKVVASYDYKNYPLMPKFPGLGLLLPDTISSTSITQVN